VSTASTQRLIFQLGTNNWQSEEEFAPGSGILHAQLHATLNALDGVTCHSVFPSRVQRFDRPDVRVFELDHDIPICESVSPVSSYRWHSMSAEDFDAYCTRLIDFVTAYIDEVEADLGRPFDLFIAHHAFVNPLALVEVNRRRVAARRTAVPLMAFVHGTSLLMFAHELEGEHPEYPPRFHAKMLEARVFESVQGIFVISDSQKDRFLSIFRDYDAARVFVTPNGIDPAVFRVHPDLTRDGVLAQFPTAPYEGSTAQPVAIPEAHDRMVLFVGKFADIKRLDALLRAAVIYEANAAAKGLSVATVIAGSGPLKEQRRYQDLAVSLGLEGAYFIGPEEQPALAMLYNVADVGVFPTKLEAFGLVFIECLACGTPVIGTAAGGPLEFVDDTVGALVPDVESDDAFAELLGATVTRALLEDWKTTKHDAALARAARYTLTAQCSAMLAAADELAREP
jgi:glycosyltransferase involved in cell wall biosynthesis